MELEAKDNLNLGKLREALDRGMMHRASGLIADLNPAEIARLIESPILGLLCGLGDRSSLVAGSDVGRVRYLEQSSEAVGERPHEVLEQQHQRDLQDTSRSESPLQVARGSVVIETTGLSLEEVVDRMLAEVEGLLSRNA